MGILIFTIMPLIFMISMAFTNYDRDHQPPGHLFDWVGLVNFGKVLDFTSDLGKTFWPVLGWTIVWAIFATFLNYIFGMVLALVINRKETKFKSFWRFGFVLSIAVPSFVTLLIMNQMLQPNGAINVLLRQIGLIGMHDSLPFLTNVTWARVTVIVINLWVGIPYTMLTMTGILQNIPSDLYEAAKIDGANGWQLFRKITIPLVSPVTFYLLVMGIIGGFQVFVEVQVMVPDGGINYSAATVVYYLYDKAFKHQQMGYGSAIAFLLCIFIFIVTAINFKCQEKWVKTIE